MRQERVQPAGKRASRAPAARDKPKGKSRIGCVLLLVLLLVGAAFALNEFGVINLPLLPRFLNLVKSEERDAEAETTEAAAEGEADEAEGAPEAVEEDEPAPPPRRPAAPAAAAAAADQRKAAEEKLRKDADQRLQRVADIVAKLAPETAVDTLEAMTLEERVAILRLLEDKALTRIIEAMDKEQRVQVLQGLRQPPGTRLEGRMTSGKSPQSGETARRSLLSLPFQPRSGAD